MQQLISDYLHYMDAARNCSRESIRTYRYALADMLDCLRVLSGETAFALEHLTPALLRSYLEDLCERNVKPVTVRFKVTCVRSWCAWLVRQGLIESNPALGLRGPRYQSPLPRFLSFGDVEKLLAAPNMGNLLGCRDHSILSTMYSAGLRISEVIGLDMQDLDLAEGLCKVRGKGRRERLAILGPPAIESLSRWLSWREKMAARIALDPTAVYVGHAGQRLSVRRASAMFRSYARSVKLPAGITPHSLRHSFATHMLSAGASLPSVKELLGHRSLGTTCGYTHVTPPQLRQVFNEKHPRA
jgi:integrase/recombinase XerC